MPITIRDSFPLRSPIFRVPSFDLLHHINHKQSLSKRLFDLLGRLLLRDTILLGDLVCESVLVTGDRCKVFGCELVKFGANVGLFGFHSVCHLNGVGVVVKDGWLEFELGRGDMCLLLLYREFVVWLGDGKRT